MTDLEWKEFADGCYAVGERDTYLITHTANVVRLTRWPTARQDDRTEHHVLRNAMILPGTALEYAKGLAASHESGWAHRRNPLAAGWLGLAGEQAQQYVHAERGYLADNGRDPFEEVAAARSEAGTPDDDVPRAPGGGPAQGCATCCRRGPITVTDAKELLTYDQAVALLPVKDRIHTLVQSPVAMLGADCDRSDILELLAGTDCREVAGPQAQASGHGLVAWRGTGQDRHPVFIETRRPGAEAAHPRPQI